MTLPDEQIAGTPLVLRVGLVAAVLSKYELSDSNAGITAS